MRSSQSEIKVAVIGCGPWGQNIARSFAKLGALSAVAGRMPERLAGLAMDLDVPAYSIQDVLNAPEIDAVAIVTPAQTHVDIALRAMKAKKAIFLEKPAAVTVESFARLAEAWRSYPNTMMVGHLLRYDTDFMTMLHHVKSGQIGRIRSIQSIRMSVGQIREDEDVVLSVGPHAVSMVLALAGSPPMKSKINGQSVIRTKGYDVASIDIQFSEFLSARIDLSWMSPVKRRELIIIGEKGMAVFDELKPIGQRLKLSTYQKGIKEEGRRRKLQIKEIGLAPERAMTPLLRECAHFLACTRTGQEPLTGRREMEAVMEVLLSYKP